MLCCCFFLLLVALFMDEIVKKQDLLLSLLLRGQSFEVREQRSFPFCGIMKPLSTSAWYLALGIFMESSITDFIYTIMWICACASVQDAGLQNFEHTRLLPLEVGGDSTKIQTGIYETCLETNTEQQIYLNVLQRNCKAGGRKQQDSSKFEIKMQEEGEKNTASFLRMD